MPRTPPRKFLFLDATIIVAAIALGTFAVWWTVPGLASIRKQLQVSTAPGEQAFYVIQSTVLTICPYLSSASLALLILRLRRPRPRLRRCLRQPGMVASAAASLALAIEAVRIVPLFALGSRSVWLSKLFIGPDQQICFAILGAWAVLKLGGVWRPEPSAIDWAGRVVGVAWIFVATLSSFRYYLI